MTIHEPFRARTVVAARRFIESMLRMYTVKQVANESLPHVYGQLKNRELCQRFFNGSQPQFKYLPPSGLFKIYTVQDERRR